MLRYIGITLAGFVIGLSLTTEAYAAKFSCKSAQELSRLGTHDRDVVVVDADDKKRQCRFSVNGEPAGSPPREQLVAARNTLRTGAALAELRRGNVEWLALMLLAAGTEEAVSADFRSQLQKDSDGLAACIQALEKSDTSFKFDNGFNTFCRSIPVGADAVEFSGAHIVQIQSAVPYFVIGARRSDDASFLFIPVGQFRGDPIP